MSTPNPDLLPADPLRGLTADAVDAAALDFDGSCFAYGMRTVEGAARLDQVVRTVETVLASGAGRDAALWTLLGGYVRLERDGYSESSDTVVRDSVRDVLDLACGAADVAPFTDDELGEVALLLSLRQIDSMGAGYLKALSEAPGLTA